MKKTLLLLTLAILGCSLPVQVALETPTATPTLAQVSIPTQTLQATPEPGSEKNPLILALAPSPRSNAEMNSAGEVIAAFIQLHTGYRLVTVAPSSEGGLIDALGKGNAQIASLSPFGYLLARENNTVTAALASVRDGQAFYGAQFIVNRDSEFTAYFDITRNENIADAITALKQFQDKKPCWSDPASASAYVVPLGLLNQAQVEARSGAFLEGQPSVVRAVYAADICDFGATFVDARDFPALESDYPDVMDKVLVVWRSPNIIPYQNISISNSLPLEMRRVIQRAFIDLMLTPEGKAAMQTVYGIDEVQVVEDAAYNDFGLYVKASRLNLLDLVEQ